MIEISSDEEEDDDDEDVDATPAPRKSRARIRYALSALMFTSPIPSSHRTRKAKEEAIIDADIDDLLDEETSREIPHDSIMDDSDEEDEVNDLLAADD